MHCGLHHAAVAGGHECVIYNNRPRHGKKVAHTRLPRVPELIPVLGSQPAGDVNHKPCGKLPLLSARPAVTPTTLKRATIHGVSKNVQHT